MLLDNTAKTNGAFLGVFNDAALLGVSRNPSTGVFYDTSKYATDIVLLGSSSDSYISFETSTAANTAPTERARIDSSGNLLVGTTTAAYATSGRGLIELNGSSTSLYALKVGDTAYGYLAASSSITELAANGASQPLVFTTNSSERARIDSSGNLLVGDSATGAYFDSKANFYSPATYAAFGGKQGGVAGASVGLFWHTATSGDNSFAVFLTEASPTVRGSITYNRGAGLVAYNVTSDYRAKDISGPVVGSGAVIDSVPVYMGKMKGATQERPMFIAHEVPAYAHTGEKDAVDADGKPVYQQMDASALIPVMWAELQSLRARVAALEAA